MMNNNCGKGLLIVVSAPSGCGKGTILAEILKDDNYYYSVSATTRKPREGEKNGVNYWFMQEDEFKQLADNGGMLEYAVYCGNYYGTPKKNVDDMLNAGKNVILEIEVQGAMNIRKICPDAVFIFINPPSFQELQRRLNKRGTESDEVIEQRIEQAKKEMEFADMYDYVIVNDELENAISDFRSVVRAQQLKVKNKQSASGGMN